MLATPSSILCAHHARMQLERQCRDNDNLAEELLGDIETFDTAGSLNLFLGNVLKQLARKRMTRKDAIALSYVSQLLLASLPVLANEKDTNAARTLIETLQRARAAEDQEKQKQNSPPHPTRPHDPATTSPSCGRRSNRCRLHPAFFDLARDGHSGSRSLAPGRHFNSGQEAKREVSPEQFAAELDAHEAARAKPHVGADFTSVPSLRLGSRPRRRTGTACRAPTADRRRRQSQAAFWKVILAV
jgi:hypothetical protein